ncbi:sigma-70 family RNA polymerase sigma factor [Xanthomonas perforans]|uniref:RNA polymerase sigma factor n=2 Tax=Xanthomonas perforans TaxID=442694 RepID=UPI001930EB6C|nr:sigma-70 family RNA polymerase sigma factor [Xanthomonas perforans]MCC8528054.1 sigma-70 family RNA polymerase sigma factor [Xanthomonas perforans]MCF5943641.1 sigma-70 family RNA polymerase sigma factor [Xanthomonas perforans]MCF5981830.1 sigma-70 family RNA polymerase sigma factor [Xanthomonas perforans]MCF5986389.1 sigma-70 family RNA polymerase sigma factor [Xanthomonas perforans]MCF6025977.1 sigma-70 family RNA polymerase sigma factor [Xanthomonas perforans]
MSLPDESASSPVTTALDEWFIAHVLPLEGLIHAFLRRHGHEDSEIPDLRQEAYARIYEAARRGLPAQTKPFVMTTVRNLLIDRIRRSRIVSIEAMADVEQAVMQSDEVTPERHLGARDELRRLQQGLQKLPHKCRQIVELRKIYGLSQREVAGRLGIAEDTVERQTLLGMRALADFMLGGTGKIQRPSRRFNKERSQP